MTDGPALQVHISDGRQDVEISRFDGTSLLTHRIHRDARPSLHPIHAPDGLGVVTQDSPSHHPWQHGLYTGFNLVNGVGFWKEFEEDGTYRPYLMSDPGVRGNSVSWSLVNDWIAPDGSIPLQEQQDWTLTDEATTFDLDLVWTLNAKADVEIGQYMAGGLFLRMPYNAANGGLAVNSEGQQNGDAEKQRARWVAVSMPIEGRADCAGFAIMDHPENPAFPVTWRVDGELGISPSRCIAEGWSIRAGSSESYRYRLHAFTGDINSAKFDAHWTTFALGTG